LVAQHRPGDMVEVGAIRYGERVDLRIRLTQAPITAATARPARRTAPASGERLGIQVSELTPELAREMGWDRPGGAVISGVRAMSAAERKGILSGQRIVSIDGREIRTAQEAREILRNARSGQILSLTLLNRGGRTTIANVRVPERRANGTRPPDPDGEPPLRRIDPDGAPVCARENRLIYGTAAVRFRRIRESGGTGRRARLRISWATPVGVRVPPFACRHSSDNTA